MKSTKSWTGLLAAAMVWAGVLQGGTAMADMATEGPWTYSYSLDTMEATLTKYSGSSISPDIPTKVSLTYNTGEKDEDGEDIYKTWHFKVTALSGTFMTNQTITTITIPNGIKAVGSSTFYKCLSLRTVHMHSVETLGSGAFQECTNLTSAVLPASVTSLGTALFAGCSSLPSINIPSSAKTIPDKCFERCSSLESVSGESNATRIGRRAFYECSSLQSVTFGQYLESIGNEAFWDCDCLQSLTLGPSVTYIGTNAFASCGRLESVSLDCPVTLRDGTFSNCKNLATVELGNNVKGLGPAGSGHHPFQNCPNIKTFQVNFGITDIPACYFTTNKSGVFSACPTIERIDLPQSLERIGDYAFDGCKKAEINCTPTLFPNLKFIGNCAFSGCQQLQSFDFLSDTLESIGTNAFCGCRELREVTLGPSVNRVEDGAFGGCARLDGISLGAGIDRLGNYVFSECSGIESVTVNCPVELPDGLFEDCTNLTSVVLGDLVKGLGSSSSHPFSGCPSIETFHIGIGITEIPDSYFCTNRYEGFSGIKQIDLPESLERIGKYAFAGCRLAKFEWPTFKKHVSIGQGAFQGCLGLVAFDTLDWSVSIDSEAFKGCTNLREVTLGTNVTMLGAGAFAGCSQLQRATVNSAPEWGRDIFSDCLALRAIVIGPHVAYIGYEAFSEMPLLASVEIQNGPTNIGYRAFAECNGLTSIAIPDSVESIGAVAFQQCRNLASVEIGGGVRSMDAGVFASCDKLKSVVIHEGTTAIGASMFEQCKNLVSVAIPDSLTSIGAWAFSECGRLTEVTIPGGVTNIESGAFRYCSTLSTVNIQHGLTRIGESMFLGCDGLKTLELPDSVTSIGDQAFWGSGLETLVIPGSVTNIGADAFLYCKNLTQLLVPPSWEGTDMLADTGVPGSWFCKVIYGGVEGAWKYKVENGTALIMEGPREGDVAIPSELGGYPVTTFEYGFFSECTNLTSVIIPDSVTNIDVGAFSGCSGLTNVTIGNGVTDIGGSAFSGCGGLATVTIGNHVVNIGPHAFYQCTNLTSVAIPDSVTVIGYSAFEKCSGLTTVSIGNHVESIERSAFWLCSSLTAVHIHDIAAWCECSFVYNPLSNAKHLYLDGEEVSGSLEIPDGVTSIGRRAFDGCSALTSVTIPDSVTSIGYYAFNACTGLASVAIGNGVTSIEDGAFYNCSHLANVAIGNGVTNIGFQAFGYCVGLEAFSVSRGNKVYQSVNGLLLTNDGKTLLQGVNGDVVIPDSVTSISYPAFYGCSGLASVTILGNITNDWPFGNRPFSGCTNLASAVLGSNMTKIASYMFYQCSALASVVIPDGVTSIGNEAFYGCSSLTNVVIPDSVAEIDPSAFLGCSGLKTIEVPRTLYGASNLNVPEECVVVFRGVEALTMASDALPDGRAGTAYGAALEATGGKAPYSWVAMGEYSETARGGTFVASGTAQGWQADDSCWDLALPFEFPYCGQTYTNAKVNSNGAISFGNDSFPASAYSERTFKALPIVAVLWRDLKTSDGDIYVESGTDTVSVRWQGSYFYSSDGAVNFSVTLCKDGRMVLSYGEGNTWGGTIGISSGYGAMLLLSDKSGSGSMANAEDIVFAPVGGLPNGLELTTDGVLRGTPSEEGEYAFTVVVTDAAGVSVNRDLTLKVAGGESGEETGTTPVAVPHSWLESDAAAILSENGGDYEKAANAKAANGMPVWECYVAGLSTTDAEAEFKVKSISFADGEVKIEWSPDLNEKGPTLERSYVLEGKPTMTDEWGTTNAASRFFRVKVALPKP